MTNEKLIAKCKELEAANEQLMTEIHTVNALLIGIGFPKGLQSLKEVALDVLDGGQPL